VGDYAWTPPNVSGWSSRTFDGYYRADGQVGTRNYWLVIPLVFCENRNIEALRDAFEEELGYGRPKLYRQQVRQLIEQHHQGARAAERPDLTSGHPERIFPNVDGIRFLVHEGGCGGTRQDSKALCGLLAGYIHHPNVAGATVLSLGCQNAQPSILMDALRQRDPALHKPVLMFEQQQSGLESAMLSEAIRTTFEGLVEANRLTRKPAPLSKLTVALKCGGSDGFSGISANPALGHVSDLLAALGAKSILAEFPELCGMEQSLINRCVDAGQADRFIQLMRDYAARAKAVHSGFEMNPSPGNIKDGLITDAMKSAGAAQVGAGANVVVFTTGLGTPTGNPIAPVIKVSTNSSLADRMADIIDIDTGAVIRGEATIEQVGESMLDLIIEVASGRVRSKAEQHDQTDFIPWKRGVSL
jgi:altronate hydrolase